MPPHRVGSHPLTKKLVDFLPFHLGTRTFVTCFLKTKSQSFWYLDEEVKNTKKFFRKRVGPNPRRGEKGI